MGQEVDFLPDSYHRNQRRREKKIWRCSLAVMFLALIVLGTTGQRRELIHLQQNRCDLQKQVSDATAQLAKPDELRKEMAHLDAKADLVTHLRLRVPTTRILAAVANSLPRFVALTEYRSTRDTIDSKSSSRPQPPKKKQDEANTPEKQPEQLDLEQTQENAQRTGLFVSLVGIAPDDVAISRYLATLEATGIFDEVQLLYTDQHAHGDHRLRKFEVRLRVKKPLDSGQDSENTKQNTQENTQKTA